MSRNSVVRLAGLAMMTLGPAAAALAQPSGLRFDAGEPALAEPPRLQARISFGAASSWSGQAGVLLGDYYLYRRPAGDGEVSGGFRATSGVLMGQRAGVLGTPTLKLAQGTDVWSATPYVGVGWSSHSLRRGWGLSADIGLAARNGAGGLRIGATGQSLDDLLRELRLAPLLQMGVSYAF